MTGATWDEREARLRRFYAAVHTDRLLSSANAAMRVADEEQAELRARLSAVSRIVGALEETVELDCDPVDGGCHDLDLTDDGRCSLVADLERIRAVIRGKS